MAGVQIKQEYHELPNRSSGGYTNRKNVSEIAMIDLDSSDDDFSSSGDEISNGKRSRVLSNGDEVINDNKRKKAGDGVILPVGFLDPLPPKDTTSQLSNRNRVSSEQSCKQFWKAGDFEGRTTDDWSAS